MEVRLKKAYKNHPKGTIIRNVNPRMKSALIKCGVITGHKAVKRPPRDKMVKNAPEAKDETKEEGGPVSSSPS